MTVLAGLESDATFHKHDLLWIPFKDLSQGGIFLLWVVKNCKSLPREVAELPSLGCSKLTLAGHNPEQPALS